MGREGVAVVVAVNHALIVSTGSMALLGEEVICVIARSYVLRTERCGDRMVLETSFVTAEPARAAKKVRRESAKKAFN